MISTNPTLDLSVNANFVIRAVHKNRFAGDPNIFYKKYQIYTLIYQLVRFYLDFHALDEHTDPPEQFDWNECVRLKALDSVINPTNMQIYTACKQHLSRKFEKLLTLYAQWSPKDA